MKFFLRRTCNLLSSSSGSKTLSSLTTNNAPDVNSIESSCNTSIKTVPIKNLNDSAPINSNSSTKSSSPVITRNHSRKNSSSSSKTHNIKADDVSTASSSLLSSSLSPSPLTAGTPTIKNTKQNNSSNNSTVGNTQIVEANNAPEVFLGGSCNPTTWRADVAIPTLMRLGISFYNPVS